MKKPTIASQKKVTPENLARLGPERLAEILAAVAEKRPDLKRRLRMELAAEQGAEHLLPEIDKRLGALAVARSRISWRQRHAFIRDLESLRALIAERLLPLDTAAGVERTVALLETAPAVLGRTKDKDGRVAEVYRRTAADLGRALEAQGGAAPPRLADAIGRAPGAWAGWLPVVLEVAPTGVAGAVLRELAAAGRTGPALVGACRSLADAAGEVDAYRATFAPEALREPGTAAEVARRLLAAGRVAEAGEMLERARPDGRGKREAGDAAGEVWEGIWIDYLAKAGRTAEAQAARWAAFERTLSVDRAREFIGGLSGFADVEAEDRALAYAAAHADFERGLGFLMGWPALREAAQMIAARPEEATVAAELAELWAGRLRGRYPEAAHLLLRKAAAMAFRRREFATCDRLTAEADSIGM
jgi:hypothetical protein